MKGIDYIYYIQQVGGQQLCNLYLKRFLRGYELPPQPGRAFGQPPSPLLFDGLHLRFGSSTNPCYFRLALRVEDDTVDGRVDRESPP